MDDCISKEVLNFLAYYTETLCILCKSLKYFVGNTIHGTYLTDQENLCLGHEKKLYHLYELKYSRFCCYGYEVALTGISRVKRACAKSNRVKAKFDCYFITKPLKGIHCLSS